MLTTPEDLLRQFPVRKTKKQQQAFLDAAQAYGASLGYRPAAEKGNLLFGDPENACYVVSVRFDQDTPSLAAVLEILKSLPEHSRERVCMVLFGGSRGISAYRKAHLAATNRQILFFLLDIDRGNALELIPAKYLRENVDRLRPLAAICGYWGKKSLLLKRKGIHLGSGEYKKFHLGVAVTARSKGKEKLETSNANILRAALVSLLCQ